MDTIVNGIKEHSFRIHTEDDLQKIVDAIGERNIVLLGEASHGTSEFYTYRVKLLSD